MVEALHELVELPLRTEVGRRAGRAARARRADLGQGRHHADHLEVHPGGQLLGVAHPPAAELHQREQAQDEQARDHRRGGHELDPPVAVGPQRVFRGELQVDPRHRAARIVLELQQVLLDLVEHLVGHFQVFPLVLELEHVALGRLVLDPERLQLRREGLLLGLERLELRLGLGDRLVQRVVERGRGDLPPQAGASLAHRSSTLASSSLSFSPARFREGSPGSRARRSASFSVSWAFSRCTWSAATRGSL